MEYVRNLKFDEDPDYKTCIDIFGQCIRNAKLNSASQVDYCWKKKMQFPTARKGIKEFSMHDIVKKKPALMIEA